MMAPSVVLQDGRPRLVVGSAGSARLRGAILQIVVNAVGHGLPVDEAIVAPRVHLDDGHVHCEGGHDPAVLDELDRRGYDVVRWRRRNLYFGGAAAVEMAGRTAGRGRRPPSGRPWNRRAERIVVRRAKPGDAGALVELAEAVASEPEGWLISDGPGGRPARSDGSCARCAATTMPPCSSPSSQRTASGRLSLGRDPHPASRHVADLGLMVSALHRRRGIGTALLREAEEWARAVGVRKLELHVFPHNDGDPALREPRLPQRKAYGAATTAAAPSTSTRCSWRSTSTRFREWLRSPRSRTASSSRRFATSSRTSRASPSRKSSESSASSASSSWRRTKGRSGLSPRRSRPSRRPRPS